MQVADLHGERVLCQRQSEFWFLFIRSFHHFCFKYSAAANAHHLRAPRMFFFEWKGVTRRVAFSVFVAGCAGRSGDGGGSNDDVTGNCILSIQRLGLAFKTHDCLFFVSKTPDVKSGRFFVFA